jgi:hypothetical protein
MVVESLCRVVVTVAAAPWVVDAVGALREIATL